MILTGYEDLRVIKTIESIKEAFHRLICEKSYDQITVKELCDLARINKKTFYKYYRNLDDLLSEMQQEVSGGFAARISDCHLPEDMERVNREFFLYSASQDPAYEKITCSQPGCDYEGIRNRMMDSVRDIGWENSELTELVTETERAILQTFIAGAVLEVYRLWIRTEKTIPLEDVIRQVNQLTGAGIRDFLDRISDRQKDHPAGKGVVHEETNAGKY